MSVPEQLPCDADADLKVVPAGSGSVTITPVAPCGPLFVNVIVEVRSLPGCTELALAVLPIARSACGSATVVVTELLLSPGLGFIRS